jgi:hypothetical protein
MKARVAPNTTNVHCLNDMLMCQLVASQPNPAFMSQDAILTSKGTNICSSSGTGQI